MSGFISKVMKKIARWRHHWNIWHLIVKTKISPLVVRYQGSNGCQKNRQNLRQGCLMIKDALFLSLSLIVNAFSMIDQFHKKKLFNFWPIFGIPYHWMQVESLANERLCILDTIQGLCIMFGMKVWVNWISRSNLSERINTDRSTNIIKEVCKVWAYGTTIGHFLNHFGFW